MPRRVLDAGKPEHAELYAKPLNRWFGVSVSKLDDRRV